jgi:hypothetical protein
MLLINPYRFAAAAAWTPAQITTALWLDAADSGTITTVSGAVSQWNDKSGNARNAAQSTAGNRPALTTVSGLQVLRFDGSNDFMNIAASFFPSGAPSGVAFIIAAVVADWRVVEGSSPFGGVIGTHADYSYNGCSLSTGNARWRAFPPSNQTVQPLITAPQNGFKIVTQVATAGTPGTVSLYSDGTSAASGSFSNTVANASVTQLGPLVTNDASYCSGIDLHELVVCVNTSSSTTREYLEGYMAWKAGLQGSLPAGHPYKNAAP